MVETLAVSLVCGFVFGCIGSVIGAMIRMRWEARRDEMIEDRHGNGWEKCLRADCSLQVVRPGKVQCDDERVLTEFGWEWKQPCVWGERCG